MMIPNTMSRPPTVRVVLEAAPDFNGPAVESARREGRSLGLDAAVALALHRE